MPFPRVAMQGFSLVELSIVLVILGLLTGGILAGKSLIRASELRTVVTEFDRYRAATYAFRDKYLAIPGDMTNATSFWGVQTTCPGDITTVVAGAATCNGNGDGTTLPAGSPEKFRFWQHLANAALIQGKYTGVAASTTADSATTTENSPSSKTGGLWNVSTWNDSGSGYRYATSWGNSFLIGAPLADDIPGGFLFTPEEAWNIDAKIDDGRPGRGKVLAYRWSQCTDAGVNTNLDGDYRLATAGLQCALAFRQLF